MKSQISSGIRAIAAVLLFLFLIPSCGKQDRPPKIEEITFQSETFTLVGDFRFPEGKGPFPVVMFVHGDGPNNRTSGGTYLPIMERMNRAGYATFAWDKPGTGESTGEIDRSQLGEQRAQIVLDAIEMLKKRQDIDAGQIGLWGISQAGYVMPRVISASEDISFMIAISCPGMPGVDQGAYLVAAQARCAGIPQAEVEQMRQFLSAIERVQSYEEYVYYKELLDAIPGIESAQIFGYQKGIKPAEEWHGHDFEGEYYWDPMQVIAQTTIPVLAFFGEKDTQADPIQGAQAYQQALEQAGNQNFQVVMVAGTDHNIVLSETGCLDEREKRTRKEWQNYAPEYLDTLEEWLVDLRR